ncbi:MAG TPA: hypothetical protein PLR32_04520, partial [candidate division Zixibacteria bacterium]|nr:hypothetical protein [candidate division Zixibacteria bacterium]
MVPQERGDQGFVEIGEIEIGRPGEPSFAAAADDGPLEDEIEFPDLAAETLGVDRQGDEVNRPARRAEGARRTAGRRDETDQEIVAAQPFLHVLARARGAAAAPGRVEM